MMTRGRLGTSPKVEPWRGRTLRVAEPTNAPFRDVDFLPRDVSFARRPDGVILARSRVPLAPTEPHLPAYLRRHASERPEQPWLAQRRGPERRWRYVSFGEAKATVDALSQGLLDLRLPSGRPLVILSGNSIEHALLTLAAMQARIPVAPISPAYSLASTDHEKLRHLMARLEPALVFVQSGEAYQRALDAAVPRETPILFEEARPTGRRAIAYEALAGAAPSDDVDRSIAAIDPDDLAKLMLTSGSSGPPKAVMQTHRMLTATLTSMLQILGDRANRPIVRLDWAPWNHVFGATNLGTTLVAGGAFHIDEGRPVGPELAETLQNLREISPTSYVNVPAGFAAIIPALEAEQAMARTFFERLEEISYAGARLPDELAVRLQAVAVATTGRRVPITAGYGATETGPTGAYVYWTTDQVGLIGLPQPGVEMKLVPLGEGRYEIRLRGPSVMPGYLDDPERTAAAFDEEGFYRFGDAATFVDEARPLEGLRFAGRTSEEFKLQTGTFVRATALRLDLLEASAPWVQDLVICGEDQAFIGVLAWPDLEAGRRLLGRPDASLAELARSAELQKRIRNAFAAHNERHPASSMRARRLLMLETPPSIDRGEVTDKGSISPRAVLQHRADLARQLFQDQPPPAVIPIERTVAADAQ